MLGIGVPAVKALIHRLRQRHGQLVCEEVGPDGLSHWMNRLCLPQTPLCPGRLFAFIHEPLRLLLVIRHCRSV